VLYDINTRSPITNLRSHHRQNNPFAFFRFRAIFCETRKKNPVSANICKIKTLFTLESFFHVKARDSGSGCSYVTGLAYLEPQGISKTFVQLGFNLSNRVTDTLESSSTLIYLKLLIGLYTQLIWQSTVLIKE
jgi:hypothetical protein